MCRLCDLPWTGPAGPQLSDLSLEPPMAQHQLQLLLDLRIEFHLKVLLAGGNIRRGVRYLVRIAKHGEGLARQTGLVDQRGRPVRGLPPSVVSGGINDAEAAWRGAFLAHGSLTEPGRSSSLEVTCPGPEAALALVGAALLLVSGRRLRRSRAAGVEPDVEARLARA